MKEEEYFEFEETVSEEILNIDHHRKALVLKALNKYKREQDVSKALGIGVRTLWNYRKQYGIARAEKNVRDSEFCFR
jgi:hypothetical protein